MSGTGGAPANGGSAGLHRRDLLLAAGTTIAVGLDAAAAKTKADSATPGPRIDAHTHFAPLKFLEFAEREEGHPFPLSPMYKSRRALIDVRARLEVLDQTGIDINVLVPVPWIEAFRKVYADPVLAVQAARLMNDELAAVVASHPTRFRGVAILPVVDPDAMVAELHRAVNELGFVGAYAAVGPTAKRMDHPDYEHLYKALVELDATLWLHPSRPPIIPDYADEKLSQYYEWLLVGWPYDTTSAMFRIVFAGVFDRYPALRIVTHHHGAFVPLLEARLANGWPLLEPVGLAMPPPTISKPYVDHFRKFYCDTASSGFAPKALELAVDFFGPERVLYGSDAPFDVEDGRIFISGTLRAVDAMSAAPETKTAILSRNAGRILKIG
ncbi:MAG TPA: amidohydrolase family protein [Xanthobacteraceae bacterium]|nr:amidohydrolase family protein [Xanthobacteraceae bacterium]